jgi:hypothetical protein
MTGCRRCRMQRCRRQRRTQNPRDPENLIPVHLVLRVGRSPRQRGHRPALRECPGRKPRADIAIAASQDQVAISTREDVPGHSLHQCLLTSSQVPKGRVSRARSQGPGLKDPRTGRQHHVIALLQANNRIPASSLPPVMPALARSTHGRKRRFSDVPRVQRNSRRIIGLTPGITGNSVLGRNGMRRNGSTNAMMIRFFRLCRRATKTRSFRAVRIAFRSP